MDPWPKRVNMTISMSNRAISSLTTREITLGMKLNLTRATRRTGTKKQKPQPEIPITNQDLAFLATKLMALLLKPVNTTIFTSKPATSSLTTRETTLGTLLSTTSHMERTLTQRPRLQLLILITSQALAPSEEKLMETELHSSNRDSSSNTSQIWAGWVERSQI